MLDKGEGPGPREELGTGIPTRNPEPEPGTGYSSGFLSWFRFRVRVFGSVPCSDQCCVRGPDLHLLKFTTIYCKISYLEFAIAVQNICPFIS